MTSSPDGAPVRHDDMPPAIPSMWRALKRGYEAEPLLLVVAFSLSLLAAVPDALLALWLKLLADGILDSDRSLVVGASLGLGVSTAATWFLRVISDRTQRRFRDRVTITLQSHVAGLQANVATLKGRGVRSRWFIRARGTTTSKSARPP